MGGGWDPEHSMAFPTVEIESDLNFGWQPHHKRDGWLLIWHARVHWSTLRFSPYMNISHNLWVAHYELCIYTYIYIYVYIFGTRAWLGCLTLQDWFQNVLGEKRKPCHPIIRYGRWRFFSSGWSLAGLQAFGQSLGFDGQDQSENWLIRRRVPDHPRESTGCFFVSTQFSAIFNADLYSWVP